ncbi:hypothetical protein K1719_031226 [Acacia pycnantha]|nr:hypothetical protein K1719_031226 [Acacia pycnantha]
MDPNKGRRKLRLDRRNAVKYVEYDAGSSSLSLDNSCGSLYTRSMEFIDRTSFRISGAKGEVDRCAEIWGFPDLKTSPFRRRRGRL